MTKPTREKIRNFFLTNKLVRKVRTFFNQQIFPFLIKAALILLTLIVLLILLLKIFKPTYLEIAYKKSSFYFLHYLNLDNHEYSEINIEGNNRTSKEDIIQIVSEAKKNLTRKPTADYQPLIHNLIDDLKSQLPWINRVVITRSMPNTLNISITEYEPFAIWQIEGKKYIIDKEGNSIPYEDSEEFRHLVILSGKGANVNAKSLFNIFVMDPDLSSNVYSATWVGNRRWDIRFENGLLIKLPETEIAEGWQRLIKIYNMPGSIIGLKIIDLRIKDKVYLEYDDSVIKELKSL